MYLWCILVRAGGKTPLHAFTTGGVTRPVRRRMAAMAVERRPSGPLTYLATCAGGCETILAKELGELQGCEVIRSFHGRVVFSCTISPENLLRVRAADNLYALIDFREDLPLAKEAALEYLSALPSQLAERLRAALALHRLWNTASTAPSRKCCCQVRTGTVAPSSSQVESWDSPQPFRVTAHRVSVQSPRHGFSSPDAAGALGGGLEELWRWPVSMRNFSVEVMAWIRDSELLLAIALTYALQANPHDQTAPPGSQTSKAGAQVAVSPGAHPQDKPTLPLQARSGTAERHLYAWRCYRKALVPTSLKPSTAFALLQLAQVRPGHLLLDPMCGCGTIPLEAFDWLKARGGVHCVGGDVEREAVDAAEVNSRYASGNLLPDSGSGAGEESGEVGVQGSGGGGGAAERHEGGRGSAASGAGRGGRRKLACDVVLWNATRLPWRDGTVDRIVCDLPFGNRCGTYKTRERLCPLVLGEMARVLRPSTGRAVLLSQSRGVKEALTKDGACSKAFQVEAMSVADMEGLRVDVLVVVRTDSPPPAVPCVSGSKKQRKQ